MEQLQVRNFLSIKSASIRLRRITILIGPQASGKSVIAKLLFFFRQVITREIRQSIHSREDYETCVKNIVNSFKNYFDDDYLNKNFLITYEISDIKIIIAKRKGDIVVDLNEKLESFFKETLSSLALSMQPEKSNKEDVDDITQRGRIFSRVWFASAKEFNLREFFGTQIFIPASRSFFPLFQAQMFSFMSNPGWIDPVLKDFGSIYENSLRFYESKLLYDDTPESKIFLKKITSLRREILVGDFVRDGENQYIFDTNKKNRTNVQHASSGQQQSLPMLTVLSTWPVFNQSSGSRYFIEEPEAHLFPNSQRAVMSLVALIYNTYKHSFVITTHSPYVLTALNNLIFGFDVANKCGYEKMANIIDNAFLVKFEDVSAYAVKGDSVSNINDSENRLIGLNVIDSVSEEFSSTFEALLELMQEGQLGHK